MGFLSSVPMSSGRDERTPAVAIKRKLPLHGCPTQAKKFGALVSYGPDLYYIGRRGAWYVDQIFERNETSEFTS